jgi:hypothetical protein
MTDSGPTFDVERLTQTWAKQYPGLVGKGLPLLNILLTEDARSPQVGAIATLSVTGSREVDMEGLGDPGRISFEIRAIGGEDGAKAQAKRGANALASALRTLDGNSVIVTSPGADGETAKLSHAANVNGPAWMGSPSGQATYRVDATLVWQRAPED